MKNIYEKPEMQLLFSDAEDIVTSSAPETDIDIQTNILNVL